MKTVTKEEKARSQRGRDYGAVDLGLFVHPPVLPEDDCALLLLAADLEAVPRTEGSDSNRGFGDGESQVRRSKKGGLGEGGGREREEQGVRLRADSRVEGRRRNHRRHFLFLWRTDWDGGEFGSEIAPF